MKEIERQLRACTYAATLQITEWMNWTKRKQFRRFNALERLDAHTHSYRCAWNFWNENVFLCSPILSNAFAVCITLIKVNELKTHTHTYFAFLQRNTAVRLIESGARVQLANGKKRQRNRWKKKVPLKIQINRWLHRNWTTTTRWRKTIYWTVFLQRNAKQKFNNNKVWACSEVTGNPHAFGSWPFFVWIRRNWRANLCLCGKFIFSIGIRATFTPLNAVQYSEIPSFIYSSFDAYEFLFCVLLEGIATVSN